MPLIMVDPQTGIISNAIQGQEMILTNILIELRVMNQLIHATLGNGILADTLEGLRQDIVNESKNPPL